MYLAKFENYTISGYVEKYAENFADCSLKIVYFIIISVLSETESRFLNFSWGLRTWVE